MRRRTQEYLKRLCSFCYICSFLSCGKDALLKEKRFGGFEASPHIGVPLIGGRKYGGGETSEGGWSIECQSVADILRDDLLFQCLCEQFVIKPV